MKKETLKKNEFAISKENYKLLIIGFIIIVIGFLLMIGGHSDDPNVFNREIFSTRRIVIAPLVVVFGFAFEIWAIMKKPKNEYLRTQREYEEESAAKQKEISYLTDYFGNSPKEHRFIVENTGSYTQNYVHKRG